MQITTEEISLEELNNNIVEYVLKTPYNTNPAILRQMLNSRGVSAPAKSTIIFTISSDDDLGDEISDGNLYLVNIITEEVVTPEELAKITLSGIGFFAQRSHDQGGIMINDNGYNLGQILGFYTSGNTVSMITPNLSSNYLTYITISNEDYTQAYIDALTQEIFNA